MRINPKAALKTRNTLVVISGVLLYLYYLFLIPLGIVGITAVVLLIYWVLASKSAVSDVKNKLQGLEAELQSKGGPLTKSTNHQGDDGTARIIGIVVEVESFLVLANQVGPQQRERWGFGLLGFGAGVAVGRLAIRYCLP